MALSPENIVNLALDAVGYPRHVQDIYEGSPPARVALELYSQTRDEVLQVGEWPFARREATLAASGQTPPSPWQHEYSYPSDCLRMLYVRPGPLTGGTRSTDPQPVLYSVFNDNRVSPAIRAILCDLTAPVLMYMGKVTDPSTWPPEFIKAFVATLAEKFSFSPILNQSAELIKARIGLNQRDMAEATSIDDVADIPPQSQASSR